MLLELQNYSFQPGLDLVLGQEKVSAGTRHSTQGGWCQGSRNALSGMNPGVGGFTLTPSPFTPVTGGPLSWGSEEGGNVSSLWEPCLPPLDCGWLVSPLMLSLSQALRRGFIRLN